MGFYRNYKRRNLLRELRGLQDEEILIRNSESKNREELLKETEELLGRTISELEALGVPVTPIEVDGRKVYETSFPYDDLKDAPKKEPPSKLRKYGVYFVAGSLIALSLFGCYAGSLLLKDWKGFNPQSEPSYNQTSTRRRDEENNTTEIPIIEDNEQPTTPQNQTQQNGTPANQTPINETPQLQIDTPDYLKSASGIFTGDTFMGRYEVADDEHNENGNYSMRLKDGNRTILEIDLDDSEGGHSFQFPTEDLDVDKEYSVELLRNGTKAYEPFKFTIRNSPPSVDLEATTKLGIDNKSRIIEYSARMSDDRGLAEANFYLYDDNGNLVQQIRKEELKGRGVLFNGLHVIDSTLKAGKYHVVAKVYDKDKAEAMASDDVNIPEIPIPPPPPPPPPPDNNGTINKTHFPPQITSAKMYIDKDTGKAIADLQIDDPDSDVFYLDQEFSDNQTGENLIGNVSNRTTMNGKSVRSEINMSEGDPKSMYEWELGVSDGENRTSIGFSKIWNWMRNLMGYWKFDGNGDDSAKDYPPNYQGGDAVLKGGAGFTQGKKNQALNLDGINDYIEIQPPRYSTGDFSVGMWFNINNLKNYQSLFDKGGQGGFVIVTEVNTEGKKRLNVMGQNNGGLDLLGITPNLNAGEWYFLTFTYDKTDGKAKTYLGDELGNLQLLYEKDVNRNANIDVGGSPIKIGNPHADGTSYWDGMIDDVRIYGHALSERQIREIYEDI